MDGSERPTDGNPFTLKKWNAIATWSWDVKCDSCAICRVHIMADNESVDLMQCHLRNLEPCLRCQSDSKTDECVVVWGDCNHCFHNCCMAQWVKQSNRCPMCQQDWQVQKIGQ